jgi:hypothetical protein
MKIIVGKNLLKYKETIVKLIVEIVGIFEITNIRNITKNSPTISILW